MLNYRVKETTPWFLQPYAVKAEKRLEEQRGRELLQARREAVGKKEGFDYDQYYHLAFGAEPVKTNKKLYELQVRVAEEDYYLIHPEITTIMDLVIYHETHDE